MSYVIYGENFLTYLGLWSLLYREVENVSR